MNPSYRWHPVLHGVVLCHTGKIVVLCGQQWIDHSLWMERAPEFVDFIRDLMPDATPAERERAMENMDDFLFLLMRMAERAERHSEREIRANPDGDV
jgi:hypothetical protein